MEAVLQKQVTKIEANPLLANSRRRSEKLRVAAYCRVSTDEEEQLNSYEAQIAYYTEFIAKNPSWTFSGIYADEGITGTSTIKRKNFLRLMSDCEKGKIDMILTKSISRFARNTVDSLSWVRKLRAMNIGVYFEEQAIDSLKAENEMLIGLFSVIAQAESENISANVRWGVQQRMKNGTYRSNFQCFGYKRGSNGVPEIVPEQAEIVRDIFDKYLDGYSVDQIKVYLEQNQIRTYTGNIEWKKKVIRGILSNEKYAGDLLLQKTFCTDCISKKYKANKGEKAKYLVSNNHPAIIDRSIFNQVQMEMARRSSKHRRSSACITEQAKYSGKYALSELLVCGECGSAYRRTGKTVRGKRKYTWRCINRIEHGVEQCDAIGVEEQKLHVAICRCLNKLFTKKDETLRMIKANLQYAISCDDASADIYVLEKKIVSLEEESEALMAMMTSTSGDTQKYLSAIESNFMIVKELREKLRILQCDLNNRNEIEAQMNLITDLINQTDFSFEEFDDVVARRLIECVRVMNSHSIVVVLKGGLQAEEVIK